ncbi:hypothetical protein [Granulicella sp. L46]|uniref:hypothetical protein n=1 Tax=Granulicella sp. L46 TaxID=1641865 RepID=UPI00131E0CE0|nr:hypothetical protein [Granulicella sp. L46]
MTTYEHRRDELVINSSICVGVLLGDMPGDMEFVPIRPQPATDAMREELRSRWPGRGLRGVGYIGLVDGAPQLALSEPLDGGQLEALADAFAAHIGIIVKSAMTTGSFAAEIERAEVSELERIYAYSDGPKHIH